MIDTSELEELTPITRLVIHTINRDVIEKKLNRDRDNDALRAQGVQEDARKVVNELEKARKRVIGRIERFDTERVNEIEQVREIIAEVGPETAVDTIKTVVGRSEDMRRNIVNTVVEWEREAGLRTTQKTA